MINLKKKELCSLDVIDAKSYLNYLSQQRTKNIEHINELNAENEMYTALNFRSMEYNTNKILIADSWNTIQSIDNQFNHVSKNISYWNEKIKQQNDRYNKIHKIDLISAGVN